MDLNHYSNLVLLTFCKVYKFFKPCVVWHKPTRTMRNHALPPNILNSPLLHQAQHRMKRASDLKRANLLEILRLEEQPDLWLRRLPSLPLRAL